VAVLKPRERLVYFRISEDEFHQFTSVCEQAGARSLSELARNAVQRLIAQCDRDREGRDPNVEMLEKLIAELTAQLRFLASLLNKHGSAVAEVPTGVPDWHSPGMESMDQRQHREE
jgi:hypothetical protein